MPAKGSGRGYYIDSKGYCVITRCGHWCKKLLHRQVMSNLCSVYCFHQPLNGDGLPAGFDVHHIDFNKQHNCACNLLLIEHSLHYAMDILWRRDQEGRYSRYGSYQEPPDWVTEPIKN